MYTTVEVLTLTYVPGLKARSIMALIDRGIPFSSLAFVADQTLARCSIAAKTIASLRQIDPYRREADKQAEQATAEGVTLLSIAEPDYPRSLREIWSPPPILWIRGSLHDRERHDGEQTKPSDRDSSITPVADIGPAVAIVGTRRATTYGTLAAERYAGTIARAGVTVVSGLARGIDTVAHEAVLRAGGRTIAVVASGLDRIQPQGAARRALTIAEKGAVVTEHPFGVRALRPYFPQRNRIISGLVAGTLVVESDVKGGAMITARFAFDQNREIFALPGPVTSPQSAGTNRLIRIDRARLTERPEDLLEELGYRLPNEEAAAQTQANGPENLTMFEQKVYDRLGAEPVGVDEICEGVGIAPGELLATLLSLEFKGCIRQLAGKRFLRT